MKTCLLSKMFPPGVGGSERYAHELANTVGERGHDIDVYTQSVPGRDASVALHENVSVDRITTARRPLVTFETLYYSLQAPRRVAFKDYDVIHGTLMPASSIALTPRLRMDIPIVVTSHGTSIDETLSHTPDVPSDYFKRYFFHPMNVVMDALAGRTADHIIAISQATRERDSSGPIALRPRGHVDPTWRRYRTLHPAIHFTPSP